MYEAIIWTLIIATVTAIIWYYEQRNVQLEIQLDSALDEIDRLVRDWAQPFNVIDHVPTKDEARQLSEPPAFTREEIEHWN